MARIFISHSSRDKDAAARMKSWLESEKFETTFLDFDEDGGIPPGADWEKTLYREVEQSQALIIVETPNWVNSKWCFAEYTQARALGKAIFPVIEAPNKDSPISPGIQKLDLTGDREGGLKRLLPELVRIALDAQGGFKWDPTRPPFPGLLAFQEEDAAIYFGRDDDIRRLIERLDARRAQGGAKLIALLGSSGSGKSSLLRAGVIPRLKRAGRNWIVVPAMRPRIHPVDELARALATASNPPLDWAKLRDDLSGANPLRALDAFAGDLCVKAGAADAQILIAIDQAEELFGVADPADMRRFLDILSRALSENLPFLAVMALRSDYLGQLQSVAALTARFEEFSLGPMPLARVPQIIEGPARVAGLGVEGAFVQQAAGDAGTEDALPLLAFALRELLNWPSNKPLTLERYQALGDEKAGLTALENAVRKAADEVLADAKPAADELTALREAFVPAMVRVNDQGEYVRRPARLVELPAKAQPLLERLATARLLVLRQDDDARVVEVAHEALLRKWPLLKSWLDSARAFLIGKQQLEQDLRDWDQAAETDKAAALLTGLKLNRARGWLVEHPTQLTAQERTFIQASIEQFETDELRNARNRRLVTLGSLAAAAVLAVVALLAVLEQRTATANESRAVKSEQQARAARDAATANASRAQESEKQAKAAQETATENASRAQRSEQQARSAQNAAIANESRALAALSQTASSQGHNADAVKLALAAWPRLASDTRPMLSRTIDALGHALSGPLEVSPPLRHEGPVYSAAFSPDGSRVVTASDDKTAQVWNAATGAPIGKPLQHDETVWSAAFSPDGTLVLTASKDKTARLWDAATGAPTGKPMQHEGAVWSAAFSPDGKRVVTASADKTARLWETPTGTPIGRALQHGGGVWSAAFSPDGKRVVTACGDKTARLWDAATGAPIGKPMQHEGAVVSAAFSPDGKLVVTASFDKTARLWDAATGKPIGRALQHQNIVYRAAFSPDSKLVATASDDKTARLWDAATGAPIGKPLQHEGTVWSAAFSPDSKVVVTASTDKTTRLWDAETGAPIGRPMQHQDRVTRALFSPDGTRVVTASWDKTARQWDAVSGAVIGQPLQHADEVSSVAFSPDGKRVVTASQDKTARLWDAATGAPIGQPLHHEDPVTSAAFSPDGKWVVTASMDSTARVWDAVTGAPISKPLQHQGFVNSAAFSPDGKWVVTASDDKTARLWDAETGAPIGKPLQYDSDVLSATFSPDGKRVAAASLDKTARVWDVSTGAPIGALIGKAIPDQDDADLPAATFSPDGRWVVTASSGNSARVWDAGTGAPVSQPLQHKGAVKSAAFSPDGKWVVTASADKSARLWDAATGAPIGKPLEHENIVNSAAFSPDGTRVVTACADNTARVWDAVTGAPIGQPMRHEDRVTDALFSPDGTRVVTASADKTARVWLAPPIARDIVATACKMLLDHDTAALSTSYGIAVEDPICAGDEPAPDTTLMIDR